MKLHKSEVTIESAGAKTTSRFSIEASQQAFAVLSSTIYEDKIKAPVRELSTNAHDAHVEAGCPEKPFEVHLPNSIDSEFRVRDYGVSLSHEDVMHLYTTYFGSNKRNSNSLNGCLGLGSKSPFAYTDQFWVTAYKDGKKRNYVATVDSEGSRLDEYPECDTDEANGFEVGFVVKEDDFSKFKDAAQQVYKYFKTQPIITGSDFEHSKPSEAKITGKGWEFTGSYGDSVAIMGNIGYPIDDDKFVDWDKSYHERREDPVFQLLNGGVVMYFDIGELSMTASREGLEYTDLVIDAIKNKAISIVEEMQERVDTEFKNCKTMFEARMVRAKYGDAIKSMTEFVSPQWNGQEVSTKTRTSSALFAHRFSHDGRVKMKRNVDSVHFNQNTVYVMQDMNTGSQVACRYFVEQNPDKTVYLCGWNKVEEQEALDALGMSKDNFVLASSLPKRPKKTVVRNGKRVRSSTVEIFKFDREGTHYSTSNSWDSRYWERKNIDLSSGDMNIYVELVRFQVEGKHSQYGVKDIFSQLEILGIDVPTIYGQPTAKCKRLSKLDNWISFDEWAETVLLQQLENNYDVDSIAERADILGRLALGSLVELVDMSNVSLPDYSYIKKYVDAVRSMKEVGNSNNDEKQAAKKILGHLGMTQNSTGGDKWEKREDRLRKRYPVLQLTDISSHRVKYSGQEWADSVVELINHSEIAYKHSR
jgi:hypothetical protein